jgi:hypothetical protein
MRQRNCDIRDSSDSAEDAAKGRPNDFKEGDEEVSHLEKSLWTSDCVRQEAIWEAAGFHITQARAIWAMIC